MTAATPPKSPRPFGTAIDAQKNKRLLYHEELMMLWLVYSVGLPDSWHLKTLSISQMSLRPTRLTPDAL